ncbi:hypothetical protein [Streptomyces sp. NBC_00198]|uniref:hypothetical protein n=1 Tax=Streptomyces sp. NBC_00198 TaxID=2975677 RepID=UPI0022510AF9|nr:hypothetical protein [Streptomyces sp. NBC_00198]MCX5285941.1 hypothetical protein [Streptomyces sp. NBC_00198]MCX5286250.1 hypothetical protein [Streptomyces sp. NBC_00198]
MADLLLEGNPKAPMTEADRVAICHGLTEGYEPQHSALRAASVVACGAPTRGEFAERVARQVDALDAEMPGLLEQYAAVCLRGRGIAAGIGAGYSETKEWRAAERISDHLWKQARDAGHTAAELLTAVREAGRDGS